MSVSPAHSNKLGLSISDAVSLASSLVYSHNDTKHPAEEENGVGSIAYLESASPEPPVMDHARVLEELKARIAQSLEGHGECILEIGSLHDGTSLNYSFQDYIQVIQSLREHAQSCHGALTVLKSRTTAIFPSSSSHSHENTPPFTAEQEASVDAAVAAALKGDSVDVSQFAPLPSVPSPPERHSMSYYGHLLIRRECNELRNFVELRIAVAGNVDAGKSTLLGVLTKGVLDDGRGKARVNLFRHKHEIESGRTSSVGMEILGFDAHGQVIAPHTTGKLRIQWDDICMAASKVMTIIDLAGHEKYLKTTVFGMTGCAPDYVMLMVGSNAGVIGMTKGTVTNRLALALGVPVYIVVTKIDMCPKNVLESTINQLSKILKSSGCRKIPVFIKNMGDVIMTASTFVSERVCPIFQVSNVTGEGVDLLRMFLNVLNTSGADKYNSESPAEFQISETFSVPGAGTVVSGTVISGIIHVGDSLLLGPDFSGNFVPTLVKSIQRKRVNVPCTSAGQSASFALKKVKRSHIRKGMVLVSKSSEPKASMEFEAEILILYHSTTIGVNYQAMLHCGCVRQTARIKSMDRPLLRTGDRAIVRFQ